VTLVRRLIAGGDAQVVLSAGPAARPLCDAIAAAVDGQIGRADGQFSLKQSAELYSRAATVVTADTGTMHLAAAVNAPIVALLGPTNPVRTGPYTTNATLLNRQLACSPCYKKTCPLGHKPAACMDQISPESVYAAVRASWTEADGSAWRRSA
jgi:ADP-heptose:LPS heptosyltransferase